MREDLLKVIEGGTDVTNALILTHNIDFVFLQSVVIPALRHCGAPALTVFADADCAAQSYQHQARVLSGLGMRYRVVPMAMRPGFRFHPKAVLLSGPQKATLLVGSGNLTFGGWRENGEIWFRHETDRDGTEAFAAFHHYMREVVDLVPLAESVSTEIEEAFDPNTREWAADMTPAGRLVGCAGKGQSLLERMKAVLGPGAVDHLFVCAPYFDEEAQALRSMARVLGAGATTVLVQPGHTNLLAQAAAALGPEFAIKAATYQHRLGSDGQTRESVLHAKFFAAQRRDEILVFAGSANCSRAALTLPGSTANAELMAHATFDKAEFERGFLNEVVVHDTELELANERQEEVPAGDERTLVLVRAARMEAGQIQVAFRAADGVVITGADVDSMRHAPVAEGPGWVTFKSTQQPRTIVLTGTLNGNEVRSAPHWIDNEYALRVSARGRSLAESISSRVRGGNWGIGAWTEVLSELYRHLEYMPKAGPKGWVGAGRKRQGDDGPVEFVWEDVFSAGYGLPRGLGRLGEFYADAEGRIGGLRAMLLRWYGIAQAGEVGDDPPDGEPGGQLAPSGAGDEGDLDVDHPTLFPLGRPRADLPAASEKERKRAVRLVSQITNRMAEPQFLGERPAELLAADLKVAAVLLRAGLADGWLRGCK